MTTREIGAKIRTMRISRDMTQEQLADAIGLSPSAVAMYEAGKRRPKDDVAEALADIFNVPKWSIYYKEDEMIPKGSASDTAFNAQAIDISSIEFALLDTMHDLSEAKKQDILEFARFVHSQQDRGKKQHDD